MKELLADTDYMSLYQLIIFHTVLLYWKVNNKKENFYRHCIREEIPVEIEINGNFEKKGSYICSTCKTAMLSGKIPSMATINGLYLPPIDEQFHLTELENNMIALIINL